MAAARQKRTVDVPVTMGSPQFVERSTSLATVVWARFPAHAVLATHRHGRTIFGVMLDGAFESRIAQRSLDCLPASVWTEPCEELHANYIGVRGASVLVVQPDPAQAELFGTFDRLLSEVCYLRDAQIASDARRMVAELQQPDLHSPLVLDGLLLAMMSQASRAHTARPRGRRAPAWLERARAYLHEHFRAPISLSDLAQEAGVEPTYFAHAFRQHTGVTLGQQLRALRVEWATQRMLVGNETLASLATRAGFSDQSHFTREFRRIHGTSPAAYRRAQRRED
ncbi:MAG: helix-turn-helix domain-containing protein [Longimicrobiales bacterium]